MIAVRRIEQEADMKKAFKIREEVFVIEQEVAPDEEYDEFEETSQHFLAVDEEGKPCGTARWRFTNKGIKLERFAVLKSYRGKGVGYALVKAVLENIEQSDEASGKVKYLHAQLPAVPLYAKFGFKKKGDMFVECNIQHFEMEKA